MPTKRRPTRRPPRGGNISPGVLEMFKRCLEIQEAGDDETWEEEGGRRRECFDLELAIDKALGRGKPWHTTTMEAVCDEAPAYLSPEMAADWKIARGLRLQLEAALDEACEEV